MTGLKADHLYRLASHATAAYYFCLSFFASYLAHHRGKNLAAQRDISCSCCSTKQGLQPTAHNRRRNA